MDERLRAAEPVPDVRVLSHDAQCDLLSATSDEYGKSARWRRVQLCKAILDQRHSRVECPESSYRGAKLIAVLVVVLLEPATPDTEDQPPAGDYINCSCHVSKQLWIAVAVAGDECPDLDVLCGFCPRPEHGPAFEMLPIVRIRFSAVQGIEVVPVVEDIDADLLRFGRGVPYLGVFSMLGMKLNGYPYVWQARLLYGVS